MDLNEVYTMLLTHEARLENSKVNDSKETKNNHLANVAQSGNFQKKCNGNAQGNWNWNGNLQFGTQILLVDVDLVTIAREVIKDRTQ